jgi:uncharacterized protein YndB with AHSA1/START domain
MAAANETHPDRSATTRHEVERSVDIDADLDQVWQLLNDEGGLSAWLGGDVALEVRPGAAGRVTEADGSRRDVLITAVERADDAHRIAWHWWLEDGPLSSVEIVAVPTSTGTRVTVVERLETPAASARGLTGSLSAGGGSSRTVQLDRGDGALGLRLSREWSMRLTHLRVAAATPRVALVG